LHQATHSGKGGQRLQGGEVMFRTIFLVIVMIWMMGLVLHFGGSVLPLLLVVAAIVLAMDHMLRRHSFN
jgi:thiol:disulfide interchange protein